MFHPPFIPFLQIYLKLGSGYCFCRNWRNYLFLFRATCQYRNIFLLLHCLLSTTQYNKLIGILLLVLEILNLGTFFFLPINQLKFISGSKSLLTESFLLTSRGMYLCRTLSYRGAEFDIVEAPLEAEMMVQCIGSINFSKKLKSNANIFLFNTCLHFRAMKMKYNYYMKLT